MNSVNIAAVILAAGQGSRFGSAKQIAPYKGKALLQWPIDALCTAGLNPIVMLGAHYQQIVSSELLDLSACQVEQVIAWQQGMSASIRAALALPELAQADGVLILLGDQPELNVKIIGGFVSAIEQAPNHVWAAEYCADGPKKSFAGVPAYFPKAYFHELAKLEGDRGARGLLATVELRTITLAQAKLFDLDLASQLL